MTAIGVFAAKKLENPQGWLEGIAAGGNYPGYFSQSEEGDVLRSFLSSFWVREAKRMPFQTGHIIIFCS